MNDEPFYSPHRKPLPPRQPTPGELLFDFYIERHHARWRVELRHHGEFGIEAQFFKDDQFHMSRTFSKHRDFGEPRTLAIAWAEEERKAIEADL